jgi:hypothetical protein
VKTGSTTGRIMKKDGNKWTVKMNKHYHRDEGRREILESFLPLVLDVMKRCPDQDRLNDGIIQLEMFIDALLNGGSHPALENWALERQLRARWK